MQITFRNVAPVTVATRAILLAFDAGSTADETESPPELRSN